jgi:hypothetical protein
MYSIFFLDFTPPIFTFFYLSWFPYSRLLWRPYTLNIYIQGVARLVDITAWGDFLSLCDKKCSYTHVCPILDGYGVTGIFNSRTHLGLRTSWRVTYSTWWLIICDASIIFASWLAQFVTERQPVLRPAVAFSKTSFKHRSIQIIKTVTGLTF